jgi:hypothetical protein
MLLDSMTTRTVVPRSCARISAERTLFKLRLYAATSMLNLAASIASTIGPSTPPVP